LNAPSEKPREERRQISWEVYVVFGIIAVFALLLIIFGRPEKTKEPADRGVNIGVVDNGIPAAK